ncbi:hypothetical protein DLAC_06621 [Tieghemostelium lacteum]|uniref:Transmembrane protein n=1 Tax=Tieghemostelium lacteum TaxID=361077 RepID=A0A151ZFB4_TIELA|nr:hypothetical protein DLAC_06621 [Tieghemostelium lacteum]|eukprot:KYQ92625.1 hypothetical protein DLAC_06621 [Tieghemostelium lacteum]
MVVTAVMLYPTNYFGTFNQDVEAGGDMVVGLSLISMQNIARGSPLMWVHLIFGFMLTAIVLLYIIRDFQFYTQSRIEFKSQNRIMNQAVFIRDIPHDMYSIEKLNEYLNYYFPNQIREVIIYHRIGTPLYKTIRKREKFVRKYERSIYKYNHSQKRPIIKRYLLCGPSKDSIVYYSGKIDQFNREINDQRSILSEDQKFLPGGGNALIIFNQRHYAKLATEAIMHRDYPFRIHRYQAPDPVDLQFHNATEIGLKSFNIRTLLVFLFICGLVVFWSIPVVFLSGFSNLDTLSQVSAFSWIVDIIEISPLLTGFLQGYLPNLVLVIFMNLLVPIIAYVSYLQGYFSQSSIERSVMRKYFFFLVFNVFFIYAVSGSILGSIQSIVDDPTNIVPMLAGALAGLGFQFINFVMVAAVASLFQINSFIHLIIRNIKLRFFARTQREIREVYNRGSTAYGVSNAKNLLIFQISLAFSTLSPFILVFSTLYFAGTYLVSKYNLIWVSTPSYQSSGKFYPSVFRRCIISIIIYHILMIGVFNIYRFFFGTLLIIPLVLTLFVWMISEYKFTRLSKYGILDNYNSPSDQSIDFHDGSISISKYTDQYRQPYDRQLLLPEETLEETHNNI